MMTVCTLAGAYRIPEGLLFGCVPDSLQIDLHCPPPLKAMLAISRNP